MTVAAAPDFGGLTVPDFGELLAEHLTSVPGEALPFLLSQLERTAAARYRGWADDVPEHREGLLVCAAREDDIADRVEELFPPSDEHRDLVLTVIPAARQTYYTVFEGLPAVQQMTIQANAERQGANAWQGLLEVYPEHADALNALSEIELQSADYLDELLPTLG